MSSLSINSPIFEPLRKTPGINLIALQRLVDAGSRNPELIPFFTQALTNNDVVIRVATGSELERIRDGAFFDYSSGGEKNANKLAIVISPVMILGEKPVLATSARASALAVIGHEGDHYLRVDDFRAVDRFRDISFRSELSAEQRFELYASGRMQLEAAGWYAGVKVYRAEVSGNGSQAKLEGSDYLRLTGIEKLLLDVEMKGKNAGLSKGELDSYVAEKGAAVISREKDYWQENVKAFGHLPDIDTVAVRQRLAHRLDQPDDVLEWSEQRAEGGARDLKIAYRNGERFEETQNSDLTGHSVRFDANGNVTETVRITLESDGSRTFFFEDASGGETLTQNVQTFDDGSRIETVVTADGKVSTNFIGFNVEPESNGGHLDAVVSSPAFDTVTAIAGIGPDPSAFQLHPAGPGEYRNGADIQSDQYVPPVNWSTLGKGLGLVNTLMSLGKWDELSDIQRLGVLAGGYEVLSGFNGDAFGVLPGSVPGVIGLFGAIESGNPLAIASAGAQLGSGLISDYTASIGNTAWEGLTTGELTGDVAIGMLDEATGLVGVGQGLGQAVPFLNLALAVESGNPVSIVASLVAFIPGWGPIAAMVINLLGGLLGDDGPPMQVGHVTASWNDQGELDYTVVRNEAGGAKPALDRAQKLGTWLDGQLADVRDAGGNRMLDFIPGKLPGIGYRLEPSQDNFDRVHLYYTDENGQQQTRYYDEKGNQVLFDGRPVPGSHGLGADYAQYSQEAVAPAFVVQVARESFTAQVGQAAGIEQEIDQLQREAQAIAPREVVDGQGEDAQRYLVDSPDPGRYAALTARIRELQGDANGIRQDALVQMQATPSVADLKQDARVSEDGLHQSLGALTFSVDSLAAPAAVSAHKPVLANLDADDYLERVDWVGSNQALLGIDLDADGRLSATELLTGNLDWLDANYDGRIDANDPGFAAIRVWVDVNGDADSRVASTSEDGKVVLQDETTGLNQRGVVAINLRGVGGPSIEREDGDTQALTEQTLTGDTRGVVYNTVAGVAGILETTEQADGSGQSVLLAANKRTFDGQADHMHGGGIAGDTGEPRTRTVEAGDAGLRSLTFRTVENSTQHTQTALGVGDNRIGQGAAGTIVQGQDSAQQTQREATATDVVSFVAEVEQPAASPVGPRETVVVHATPHPALAEWVATAPTTVASPIVLSGQVASAQTTATVQAHQLGAGMGGAVLAGQTVGPQAAVVVETAQHNGQSFIALPQAAEPIVVALGDSRVQSDLPGAAAPDLLAAQVRNSQATLNQPLAFVPAGAATLVQERRDVTAEMIRSAGSSFFGPAGSPLVALALGAAGAALPLVTQAQPGEPGEGPSEGPATSPPGSFEPNWPQAPMAYGEDAIYLIATATSDATGYATTIVFRQVNLGDVAAAAAGTAPPVQDAEAPAYTATLTVTWTNAASTGVAGGNGLATGSGTTPLPILNAVPDVVLQWPVLQNAQLVSQEDAGLTLDLDLLLQACGLPGPSGQGLSLASVGGATHGRVSLQGGQIVFIPDANYFGPASFSYTVIDQFGLQSTAVALLDLQPVNDVPLILGEGGAGREDAALLIDTADLLANDSDVEDGPQGLTLTAVGAAEHGSVSMEGGRIVFRPDADYHGPASFSYTVTDREGASTVAVAQLEIAAVNDAPAARGEQLNSAEDEGLIFLAGVLLANDADVDGDSLYISRVGQASNGTVFMDAQGQVRFVPTPDYSGPASFTYWVSDGQGGETAATAHITIAPVNDAPFTVSESVDAGEDAMLVFSPATLLANDGDIDGPTALQIVSVGGAQHGQVAVEAQPDGSQQIVFTPQAHYFGAASFRYAVSDGAGGVTYATVKINLTEINDVPLAVPDEHAGFEDSVIRIPLSQLLGNDIDPDTANAALDPTVPGDVLAVTAVGNALHGHVALDLDPLTQLPCVAFTSDPDYFGPASFTYTMADGRGGASAALVTLNVVAVNDAPLTTGEAVASNEDAVLLIAPAALLVNDLDIDNPHAALRISAVGPSTHGTAVLQADGLIAFHPEADYVGSATFEYTVDDGAGGMTQATATVVLANVNDAPQLHGETVSGQEDVPVDIVGAALLANDVDIDSPHSGLSITAVGNAVHGAVALNGDGSIRFTPAADYNETQGPATFEYTVSDGDGGSTVGVATLSISAVNDAPVVAGEVASAQAEDTVLTFSPLDLLANDTDVDNTPQQLGIAAVGGAVHGSVALAGDGSVVFTPELNYNGPASFTYTVSDGAGGATQAVVALSFTPVNDAPILVNDLVLATEDTQVMVSAATLLANDSDVDGAHGALQVTAVGDAQHGMVSLGAGGQILFTPDADFNGAASFSYTVTDGVGGMSIAAAQVQVVAANDVPLAQTDALPQQLEDSNLVITAAALLSNDSDVDMATNGQILHIDSVSAVAGQTHGTVSLTAGGDMLYIPDQDYAGPVSFAYTVSDGAGGSADSTASFELANVNDAPVLAGDLFSTKDQAYVVIQPFSLLANDGDPDAPYTHDVLAVTSVGGAQNGTATLQGGGSILFTPDAGFAGVAQFIYEVSDGNGATSLGVAQVNTVNVAPVAVGEAVQVQEDAVTVIDSGLLLANDSDIDNAPADLRIVAVGNATHGGVALNAGGQAVYTPDLNYFGPAQFSYTVSDGEGGFAEAVAGLNVLPVNDAPVVTGESAGLQEDQVAVFSKASLLANDDDIETPGGLSIIGVGAAQHGTVQMTGSNVTFTPNANFYGNGAGFSYTVSDGQGGQSVGTVSLAYAAVNDVPLVNSEVFEGLQDTQYIFSYGALLANDTDADTPYALSLTNVYGATNNTAYMQGGGVVFTPTAGFSGYASFNYSVTDPDGATSEGTAYVNLVHVNHNPFATDDAFDAIEDVGVSIAFGQLTANDFDVDSAGYGDMLTISSVFGATNGSVGLGAGVVHFTPPPDYSGPASFGYQVSDGKGGSAFATAYLYVQPVNDAPVIDQVTYGWENTSGTVIAHDVDGPGAMSYSIVQGSLYGAASIDGGGNWSYLGQYHPFDGNDPFIVQVSDGVATQWVNVYAHHAPPAPIDNGGGGPGSGSEPVVIDLAGDGVQLLSPQESNMFIDLDGDGLRERVGWAAPDDAVLAYDRNRDGVINLPNEVSFVGDLPGAKTDLEGLRAFDIDGDGKLTAADSAWADFGLLQDVNNNGVQDAGEFTPLSQSEIVAIGLDRQGGPEVNNGNLVHGTSQVDLKDGTQVQAHDAYFSAIPWESAGQQVPVPPSSTAVAQAVDLGAPEDITSTSDQEVPPHDPVTVLSPSASGAGIVLALAQVPDGAMQAAVVINQTEETEASDADIASQALLLNSWSNAPAVSEPPAAFAFVPLQGATEILIGDPSSEMLAANDPVVPGATFASTAAPCLGMG